MADVQVNLGAALFRPGRPSTILASSPVAFANRAALAFPSSVPCRSRCHVLAGLARAREHKFLMQRFESRRPKPASPSLTRHI